MKLNNLPPLFFYLLAPSLLPPLSFVIFVFTDTKVRAQQPKCCTAGEGRQWLSSQIPGPKAMRTDRTASPPRCTVHDTLPLSVFLLDAVLPETLVFWSCGQRRRRPTRDTTASSVSGPTKEFPVFGPDRDTTASSVSGPTKEFPVFGSTRDTTVSLVLPKSFQSLVLPEILQCLWSYQRVSSLWSYEGG